MRDDKEILNSIKQTVQQIDAKAEVVLFGSRARGNHRPDSDWDIVVINE